MAVIHFLGYLTFIAEIFLYNSLDFVLLLFMGHSDDAAAAGRLLLPRHHTAALRTNCPARTLYVSIQNGRLFKDPDRGV